MRVEGFCTVCIEVVVNWKIAYWKFCMCMYVGCRADRFHVLRIDIDYSTECNLAQFSKFVRGIVGFTAGLEFWLG